MGSFFENFLERTALFSCPNYELSVNNAEQEERRRYQCPLQFYGNQHAQYKLGKLYLTGELVNKDIETALRYLKDAAQRNNQFEQYTLGKLYLQGKEVHQDREAAKQWLELSAAQGNQYAQFFLDRFNDFRDPSILMSTTRLLHHMSRIFQNNSQPLQTRTASELTQSVGAVCRKSVWPWDTNAMTTKNKSIISNLCDRRIICVSIHSLYRRAERPSSLCGFGIFPPSPR